MGPRRWLVVLALLAVAVGAVLAAPRVDLPSVRSDRVDDGVALPTDLAEPRPTSAPSHPNAWCADQRPSAPCMVWAIETRPAEPLGPRLPGADVLFSSTGARGLQARDAETGALRWTRDDVPEARALGLVDGTLVARTRSMTRGFDVDDGSDRWAKVGFHPVGRTFRLTPPLVVLGAGERGETSSLVALDPADGHVVWEWTPDWPGPVTSVVSPTSDAIHAAGAGQLARVDAATGTTQWTVETVDAARLQAHDRDHVTAQSRGQEATTSPLAVHDAATGEVVLRLRDGDGISSHTITGGVLVVHRLDGDSVDAIALRTGEERWSHPLRGAGSLAATVDGPGRGAVVVTDGEGRHVRRLDPTSGDPMWEVDLPPADPDQRSRSFLAQPMLVGDHVVVEDRASVVTVLDLATGRPRVRVDGGGELNVRSLDPLTLVRGSHWARVDVRDRPAEPQ